MRRLLLLLLGFAGLAQCSAGHRPCGRNDTHDPKLVVNSHGAYSRPLEHLLSSLYSVGFADFCRVIVVVGGAGREEGPVIHDNITYFYTVLNAHDFTGLNVLSEHRNDTAVKAPGYFYVLDTCLFHPGFTLFWGSLRAKFEDPMVILSTHPPWTSNIAAFGYGVVANLGDAFKHNFTKYDAQSMEGNGTGVIHSRFGGQVTWTNDRTPATQDNRYVDLYQTGHPRMVNYYPDFYLYKALLWGEHGEFQGQVVRNEQEIGAPWPPPSPPAPPQPPQPPPPSKKP